MLRRASRRLLSREKLETRQAYNERHAQENAAGLAAAQEKRAKLMAGKDQRDAAIASGRARLERGRRAFTQALEASAAVILARRVMKAGEYAWLKNLSDQRAYGLEANGRIFTKSYPEKYASYAVAGRVDEVSKYQWRAPGEWFAEMYAAYFGGYLAKNHPQRAWLKGIVDQPIAAPAEETPAPPEPQITEPVEAPNPVREPPSSEPVSSGQKELPDPSVTAQALISEPPSEAPSLPTPQSSPEMPPTTSTAPTPEASDEPASMAAVPHALRAVQCRQRRARRRPNDASGEPSARRRHRAGTRVSVLTSRSVKCPSCGTVKRRSVAKSVNLRRSPHVRARSWTVRSSLSTASAATPRTWLTTRSSASTTTAETGSHSTPLLTSTSGPKWSQK